MDSLSQFTLGAALGEAVLGKKIGNKAILWGGLAGTIPDLDVLFMPLISDPAVSLNFHRGFSHSFVFCFLMALLLGYWVHRWYTQSPENETTFRDWFLLFLLGLVTHPILDSFTTWGTQLLLPFDDTRFAFNNIFVADPIYTLPFTFCLLAAAFCYRTSRKRRLWNYAGLAMSCAYLLFTFSNKLTVSNVVTANLDSKGIDYQRFMTAPTPLNNFLWYILAETEEGYQMGLYSSLDKTENIDFEYFARNDELLDGIRETPAVHQLIRFSQGYYTVQKDDAGELIFYDLKFGKKDLDNKNGATDDRFIFPFYITKDEETGKISFEQDDQTPSWAEAKGLISTLWNRMKGI